MLLLYVSVKLNSRHGLKYLSLWYSLSDEDPVKADENSDDEPNKTFALDERQKIPKDKVKHFKEHAEHPFAFIIHGWITNPAKTKNEYLIHSKRKHI